MIRMIIIIIDTVFPLASLSNNGKRQVRYVETANRKQRQTSTYIHHTQRNNERIDAEFGVHQADNSTIIPVINPAKIPMMIGIPL